MPAPSYCAAAGSVNSARSVAAWIVRPRIAPVRHAVAIAVAVGPVRHTVAIPVALATVAATIAVATVNISMPWAIIVRHRIAHASGQAGSGGQHNNKLFQMRLSAVAAASHLSQWRCRAQLTSDRDLRRLQSFRSSKLSCCNTQVGLSCTLAPFHIPFAQTSIKWALPRT